MKNMVTMIVSIMLGALMMMIVMTLHGRINRSMEIESNLPSIVEETVENMTVDAKYTISNYDEFVADLTSELSPKLDADSSIIIKVLNADMEKGILSVRVEAEYTHPNGKRGTVECERTVIFNKVYEAEQETYTVKFFLKKEDVDGGRPYKVCEVYSGEVVAVPTEPKLSDAFFSGWFDPNDYAADFSVPVTGDLIYYAAWN